MGPTIDQRRAKHAFEAVEKLPKGDAENYAREAKKLPVRIVASGLGQALVFIQAKAKRKRGLEKLSKDLSSWVVRQQKIGAADDLLQSVMAGDADLLRRATAETMAYLQWLNRFLEAKGLGDSDDKGT